jgi:hypothetical protein
MNQRGPQRGIDMACMSAYAAIKYRGKGYTVALKIARPAMAEGA